MRAQYRRQHNASCLCRAAQSSKLESVGIEKEFVVVFLLQGIAACVLLKLAGHSFWVQASSLR